MSGLNPEPPAQSLAENGEVVHTAGCIASLLEWATIRYHSPRTYIPIRLGPLIVSRLPKTPLYSLWLNRNKAPV
jgi:hypothetical protein